MGSFHWSPGHCHLWQRQRVIHHWRRSVGSGWYPFELNRSPQQQLRVFPKRFMQINYHKSLRFTDVLMASTRKRKTTHKTNTNALEAYKIQFCIACDHFRSFRLSDNRIFMSSSGCRVARLKPEDLGRASHMFWWMTRNLWWCCSRGVNYNEIRKCFMNPNVPAIFWESTLPLHSSPFRWWGWRGVYWLPKWKW